MMQGAVRNSRVVPKPCLNLQNRIPRLVPKFVVDHTEHTSLLLPGVANRSLPNNQHAGFKRSSTAGAGVVAPTTANVAMGTTTTTTNTTLDNGSAAAIRKKAKL